MDEKKLWLCCEDSDAFDVVESAELDLVMNGGNITLRVDHSFSRFE